MVFDGAYREDTQLLFAGGKLPSSQHTTGCRRQDDASWGNARHLVNGFWLTTERKVPGKYPLMNSSEKYPGTFHFSYASKDTIHIRGGAEL